MTSLLLPCVANDIDLVLIVFILVSIYLWYFCIVYSELKTILQTDRLFYFHFYLFETVEIRMNNINVLARAVRTCAR